MDSEKLTDFQVEKVAGGSVSEFYNTCSECGKKWDMAKYGYGSDAMPEWVTGPLCPECRAKQQASKESKIEAGSEQFYNTCKICGKKWDMRKYGYGEKVMPNWVTGPWCPECRNKLNQLRK